MTRTRTQTVRIVNDGNASKDSIRPSTTHIFDAHTGEELSGVASRVEIILDAASGIPQAAVTFFLPIFDITVDAEITEQPLDWNDIDAIAGVITVLERRMKELLAR